MFDETNIDFFPPKIELMAKTEELSSSKEQQANQRHVCGDVGIF